MNHQLLIKLLDGSVLGLWGSKGDADVRWGVTSTKVFSTSGSDSLFFPNLWMLNAAIFMATVKKQEGM